MAGAETSAEASRVMKWLIAGTLFFLAALIGIITVLAEGASDTTTFIVFGALGVPAVFVIPVWAVWGLSSEEDEAVEA